VSEVTGLAEAIAAEASETNDTGGTTGGLLLGGVMAVAAMHTARHGARHVEIGNVAAPTITLPALLVRSVDLDVLGFTHPTVPLEVRRAAYLRLTQLVAEGRITVDLEVIPLAEIGAAWARQRRADGVTKLVLACSRQMAGVSR
jgi:hypothetical protein